MTTNVSEIESSCSCCCSSSCCACLASGVFVKSKSVVSDPANSVDADAIAATRTRNQIPTVRHGWWLLAFASDSGLILIPGSPFPCRLAGRR